MKCLLIFLVILCIKFAVCEEEKNDIKISEDNNNIVFSNVDDLEWLPEIKIECDHVTDGNKQFGCELLKRQLLLSYITMFLRDVEHQTEKCTSDTCETLKKNKFMKKNNEYFIKNKV